MSLLLADDVPTSQESMAATAPEPPLQVEAAPAFASSIARARVCRFRAIFARRRFHLLLSAEGAAVAGRLGFLRRRGIT